MSDNKVEKLVDNVLDLCEDLNRAEDNADAAYRDGDLERYEDLLREINRLDGVIYELSTKIASMGGL